MSWPGTQPSKVTVRIEAADGTAALLTYHLVTDFKSRNVKQFASNDDLTLHAPALVEWVDFTITGRALVTAEGGIYRYEMEQPEERKT